MKLNQLHEVATSKKVIRKDQDFGEKTPALAWLEKQWKVTPESGWKIPLRFPSDPVSHDKGLTLFRRVTDVNNKIVIEEGEAEVDMYVYQGNDRTTPIEERSMYTYRLESNPPFKFGTVSGTCLVYKGEADDVSKFPKLMPHGGIELDGPIKSLKGISRACKELGFFKISNCDSNLSGMLELAMITYTSNVYTHLIAGSGMVADSRLARVRDVLYTIRDHVKKYGTGQKILELRKELISKGLEMHL